MPAAQADTKAGSTRSCQATVKGGDGHHELACVLMALWPSTGTAAANVPAVGPATMDAEPISAPSAAAPREPSFEAEPPANEYRSSGGGAQASGEAAALALGATEGDAEAELDEDAATLFDGDGDNDGKTDADDDALVLMLDMALGDGETLTLDERVPKIDALEEASGDVVIVAAVALAEGCGAIEGVGVKACQQKSVSTESPTAPPDADVAPAKTLLAPRTAMRDGAYDCSPDQNTTPFVAADARMLARVSSYMSVMVTGELHVGPHAVGGWPPPADKAELCPERNFASPSYMPTRRPAAG